MSVVVDKNLAVHPIAPVFDERSHVLILGSFPSVKSREAGFYYAHPQNRFYKVMSAVFCEREPVTVPEKTAMLLGHGVALWDVIERCEIVGSSDASIKRAVPNDIGIIFAKARIERVFTNGQKAHELYQRYLRDRFGIEAAVLPSTSPANASWSLDRLIDCWSAALTPVLSSCTKKCVICLDKQSSVR